MSLFTGLLGKGYIQQLTKPSGFTYTPPFNIFRVGYGSSSTFTTDYNPLNKRPTPTATVWVSSATGNNNNDGTTQLTSVRSLTLGVQMANLLGGTVLIKVDTTNSYLLSAAQTRSGQPNLNAANIPDVWHTAFVNTPTCNIVIESWNGTGKIKNIMDRAAVTFSATTDPNIYVATWAGTTAPCMILPDPAFIDPNGYPIGMNSVWTVVDVNNPWPEINAAWTSADTAATGNGPSKYSARGAVFHDTTNKKVYVRRGDNSAPGTAINLYSAGAFPGMSVAATATITMWIKDAEFWGGDQGIKLMPNAASGFKVNLYTWNCAYLFTGNSTGNGGLFTSTGGGGEVINYLDYARGCSNDSYGIFGADLITQANSYDRAELFCKSWLSGVSTVSLTINGSTSHVLCRTVRVGSIHKDAVDRTIHDINGTLTWDLGVTASNRRGPSGGTTAACFAVGQSGQSAPFATKWMDACVVADGLNGAAQYATESYTGCTLNYANMSFTPTAGDGTGITQTYTP